MSAKETTAALDEKDRKKKEKMAKMMAGFDLGDNAFSENEARMRDMLDQVESLHAASLSGEKVSSEVLDDLRTKLLESRDLVRQAETSLNDRAEHEHGERTIALEDRLTAVQQDYEDLLTRNLSPEDVEDVKARLEQLYSDRKETQTELVHDLKDQLAHKSQEIEKLEKSIADLQARGVANWAPNGVANKGIQQQMAEFDQMKKNLMRDLQNRCERVVELEISLDETREQYNNVLRSSNNRQQQKKMAFLERNLEQLTVVQRQLVDQNTSLKKEVAIAERKLIARNERILSLESLLSDSQDKLTAANHRFEQQLAAVKERLEAAKVSSRNMAAGGPGATGGFNSLMNAGARIAKPLRGGGGAPTNLDGANGAATLPIISSLTGSDGGNKRSSWFFNTGR